MNLRICKHTSKFVVLNKIMERSLIPQADPEFQKGGRLHLFVPEGGQISFFYFLITSPLLNPPLPIFSVNLYLKNKYIVYASIFFYGFQRSGMTIERTFFRSTKVNFSSTCYRHKLWTWKTVFLVRSIFFCNFNKENILYIFATIILSKHCLKILTFV